MKKILIALLGVLLFLSACTKADDPKTLLQKAYEKQQKLKTYTYEGEMNIVAGEDGSSGFNIPATYIMMFDNNNTDNTDDDKAYVSIDMDMFGYPVNTKTWTVGNVAYTDDGYNKTRQEVDIATTSSPDISETIANIISNTESITVSNSGSDKVLNIKLRDPSAGALLEMFGSSDYLEDVDDVTFEDLIITIDKDNLIRKLEMAANTSAENTPIKVDLTMTLKDEDNTVIPSFNPDDFTDASYSDSYGDGSFEDIVFDDGTELLVYMDKFDEYLVYFDEQEQLISIHDNQTLFADGMLLNGSFISELYNSIDSTDAYVLRYENTQNMENGKAKIKVCFSQTDTDIFNANTPFAIVMFEGYDLGALFVGYGTEEEFKTVMDQTSYEVYKTEG